MTIGVATSAIGVVWMIIKEDFEPKMKKNRKI